MSQTTRCPSCATLFKVVPDQLRISDGWVRCGKCKKVFDATLSLQEISAPAPPQNRNAEQLEAPSLGEDASGALGASDQKPALSGLRSDSNIAKEHGVGPDSVSDQSAKALPEEPELSEDGRPTSDPTALVLNESPPHGPVPSDCELPAVLPENLDKTGALANPEPVMQGSETRSTAEPAEGSGSLAEKESGPPFLAPLKTASLVEGQGTSAQGGKAARKLEGEAGAPFAPTGNAEATLPVPSSDPPEEDPAIREIHAAETLEEEPSQPLTATQEPSFVRSARRKALWDKPSVHLALGTGAVLLACGLLLQVAVQQRDYLASAQPQWRSALEALCVPLQCTVRPYQHIASVVVESSSFNKLSGNTYRFALALKNQSGLAVATPAVELTLTDTSDQPVLRRAITSLELSAPATLAAAGEWMGSLEMDIALDGNARIAGYRVLIFYP